MNGFLIAIQRILPISLKSCIKGIVPTSLLQYYYQLLGTRVVPIPTYNTQMKINFRNPAQRAYATTRYEWYVAKFIKSTIQPGWVVIDVGAYIGFHTLGIGKLVKPGGIVYAFEPIPSVVEHLVENVNLNSLSDVVLIEQTALGNTNGTVSINVSATSTGILADSSITRAKDGPVISVSITKLDDWVKGRKLGRCDFIKIDVEGLEIDVLEGGKLTIEKFRPFILIEVNDKISQDSVVQWLICHKYIVCHLGSTYYGQHLVGIPKDDGGSYGC